MKINLQIIINNISINSNNIDFIRFVMPTILFYQYLLYFSDTIHIHRKLLLSFSKHKFYFRSIFKSYIIFDNLFINFDIICNNLNNCLLADLHNFNFNCNYYLVVELQINYFTNKFEDYINFN
jgi:hypothetical protein